MKKHDWMNKADGSKIPDAVREVMKSLLSADFEQVAADPGKKWREQGLGDLLSWEKVSAESKCRFLASHAAICEVSYDRFAKAVGDALGGQELQASKKWSLRGQYEQAWRLFVPDHDPAPTAPEPSPKPGNDNERDL